MRFRKRQHKSEDSNKLGLKELVAMGVGGMIGGGIFSVLGLAVAISGKAAPLAFALGSIIAFTGGYSYIKLALAYKSDGASFTYLERAFPRHTNIAGAAGWTIIAGYVGTLSLYAFTFGAYGADLLGMSGSRTVRLLLSAGVLLLFMLINLHGARTSGVAEDLVVYTKIVLLTVFGVAGMLLVDPSRMTPVFSEGLPSVFIAGALIFVAYEGFELITNAVCETRDPDRNIPRGIYISIAVTSLIYITLTVVAIGNLSLQELTAAEEYALALVAQPIFGDAGHILIGLAALLATSSAINSTSFGASRMMADMAADDKLPHAFSFRTRSQVPWMAVVILTVFALAFTLIGDLKTIASYASMTFLLVSIGVSVANLRLRKDTGSNIWLVLVGILLMSATAVTLAWYLWLNDKTALIVMGGIYLVVLAFELLFSKRRIVFRR